MWFLIIIIIIKVLFLTKLITSTSRLNSCILTCFSFNSLKKWYIKPEGKCKIDVFSVHKNKISKYWTATKRIRNRGWVDYKDFPGPESWKNAVLDLYMGEILIQKS